MIHRFTTRRGDTRLTLCHLPHSISGEAARSDNNNALIEAYTARPGDRAGWVERGNYSMFITRLYDILKLRYRIRRRRNRICRLR